MGRSIGIVRLMEEERPALENLRIVVEGKRNILGVLAEVLR